MKKIILITLLLIFLVPTAFASDNTTDVMSQDSDYTYNVDAPDSELDTPQTVTVTMPDDAEGDITFLIYENIYTSTLDKGSAKITIPNLTLGHYVVEVSYPGDMRYSGFNTYAEFDVTKVSNYNLTINAPPVVDGKHVNVSVSAPSDAEGKIYLYFVNGSNYSSTLNNGISKFYFSKLTLGIYNITAVFNGDEKYNPKNTTGQIIITPDKITYLNVNGLTKYYGSSTQLAANLSWYYGRLSNQELNLRINNKTYKCITDDNGTAYFNITEDVGKYEAFIFFNGSDDYDAINSTVNVTVQSTVFSNDIVKMIRNGTNYYAQFLGTDGNPLVNATVGLTINGKTYNRVTNASGMVKLNINLNAGEYVLNTTNPVTNQSRTNSVVVKSKITDNRDLVKYYRNASQYSVRVLDSVGNPVGAGEEVTFNINGVIYVRTTNSSGYAKLNINLHPGTYIITAYYKNSAVSNNITILARLTASDLTKTYGTSDQFVAHLLDGTGNVLSGVNVGFNVNGIFYNRTTDSNGDARLNIRLIPGEYIITSTYEETNVGNKITVLD